MGIVNPFQVPQPNFFQRAKDLFSPAPTPNFNEPTTRSFTPPNITQGTSLGDLARQAFIKVKDGDTFASIAAGFTGTTEEELQSLNNQSVLPPRGSYISGPTQHLGLPQEVQRSIASYQPAQSVSAFDERAAIDRATNFGPTGFIPFVEQEQSKFNRYNEMFRASGQLDRSLLPNTVSVNTVSQLQTPDGRQFSYETMQSLGYEYNDNGSYVKGGVPKTTQTQGTLLPGQTLTQSGNAVYRWRRKKNGKWDQVKEGKYNADKQNRDYANFLASQVAPDLASGAGVTPVTTLDVRLGSG